MKIQTAQFGEVGFEEGEVIRFPDGLLGFDDLKRYLLIEAPDLAPLKWLQSVDEPGIAFVICDPAAFAPEYHVQLTRGDLMDIELTDASKGFVLVIVTAAASHEDSTANLKGPLILNLEKNLGKQVVLADDRYPVRYRIHEGLAASQQAS